MRKLSAALLIMFITSAAPAYCKKDSEKGEDKKHVLVDEIIEAVQTEDKLSEEETAALKAKQKERMDRLVDVIADKAKMSDEEKAKLKEKIAFKKEPTHAMHARAERKT